MVDPRQFGPDGVVDQDGAGGGDLGDPAGSVHGRAEVVPALAQNAAFSQPAPGGGEP